MNALSGTLRRSAIIGLVATLADLAMLALLVHGLHVAAAWANVPALSVGLALQFVGNKFWAFENRATDPAVLARQGGAFLLVEAIAFILNAGFFHIFAVALAAPPLFARLIASTLVYFGFSYRFWTIIFTREPSR